MLDIRFEGAQRFIVGFGSASPPDNADVPPPSQAMACVQIPPFPVQGVHWTRHERPRTPRHAARLRAHLRVVK
jgi:hypothetical protein